MENKFSKVMLNKSDSELLEITTKFRDDYQSEAVEAAESEIKRRNLSLEQLNQAKEELKGKEVQLSEKENESLESFQ